MTIFSFQYPKSARQFVVLSLSDLLPQNIDRVIQKWLEWLLFGQQGQTFFFDPQVPLAQLKGQRVQGQQERQPEGQAQQRPASAASGWQCSPAAAHA
jgi:hypothetical protein